MTTSAPANRRPRSSVVTSALTHCVRSGVHAGIRRATPTICLTRASRPSASSTLVPTLPVAPVTTIRMTKPFPTRATG